MLKVSGLEVEFNACKLGLEFMSIYQWQAKGQRYGFLIKEQMIRVFFHVYGAWCLKRRIEPCWFIEKFMEDVVGIVQEMHGFIWLYSYYLSSVIVQYHQFEFVYKRQCCSYKKKTTFNKIIKNELIISYFGNYKAYSFCDLIISRAQRSSEDIYKNFRFLGYLGKSRKTVLIQVLGEDLCLVDNMKFCFINYLNKFQMFKQINNIRFCA